MRIFFSICPISAVSSAALPACSAVCRFAKALSRYPRTRNLTSSSSPMAVKNASCWSYASHAWNRFGDHALRMIPLGLIK